MASWLKGWSSEHRPKDKPEHVVVTESLMTELEYQIKELELEDEQKKQEEKKKASGGVDYSWLVSAPPKTYEVPQMERLELEELASKIKATECGTVITMFRDSMCRKPDVQEVPRIMKAVLIQTLDRRPKDPDTMSEWMSKSLTKLKSQKIVPVSVDENGSAGSMCGNSDPDKLFCTGSSVDDLPV